MNDKEKVVMRLEGKTIHDLRDEYYKIGDLIIEIIADKKNWMNPCGCPVEDTSAFSYLNEGDIIKVCINCGGDIER